MKSNLLAALTLLALAPAAPAGAKYAGRACRSVHLWYRAPQGAAFYNEVSVDRSAEGTYFMACGFHMGYLGIQEQGGGKKVAIFSVWEPGDEQDQAKVPEDRRVKLVAKGEGVRVGRFGHEGTGGQSFLDIDWKPGVAYGFLVRAEPEPGGTTRFAGHVFDPASGRWHHLATFSTRADGKLLRGYYSFVEDFRRDRVSLTRERVAHFGNGWVKPAGGGAWVPLAEARFTADKNPATTIDARLDGDRFVLATGGATANAGAKLGATMARPWPAGGPPAGLPGE